MNQLAEGRTRNLELAGSISFGEFGPMHGSLFAVFVGALRASCPLDQPHEEAIEISRQWHHREGALAPLEGPLCGVSWRVLRRPFFVHRIPRLAMTVYIGAGTVLRLAAIFVVAQHTMYVDKPLSGIKAVQTLSVHGITHGNASATWGKMSSGIWKRMDLGCTGSPSSLMHLRSQQRSGI